MAISNKEKRFLLLVREYTEKLFSAAHTTGPFRFGSPVYAGLSDRIMEFRNRICEAQSPYLLNPFHQQLEAELNMDEESAHFAVTHGEEMLGAIRLKQLPFEWTHLSPELALLEEEFAGYSEFNRLQVHPEGRHLGAGPLMISHAAYHAAEQGSKGIVALCRKQTARVFGNYGLQAFGDRTYQLDVRDHGDYYLMYGSWPMICRGSARYFRDRWGSKWQHAG